MFGFNLFKKKPEQKLSPEQDLEREMKRRKNQANAILADLILYKVMNTAELEQHAFNYTGRISDLRKRGYKITCEYVKPGLYRYTYGGFEPKAKL